MAFSPLQCIIICSHSLSTVSKTVLELFLGTVKSALVAAFLILKIFFYGAVMVWNNGLTAPQ